MATATLKLYEIAAEYRELAEKLSNLDLDAETIADTLSAEAGEDFIDKAGNIIALAASMDAEAGIVEAAAKRQGDRAKSLRGRAEGLREYVLMNMKACQMLEVKRPDFIAKVRDNPGKVVIDAEDQIPDLYVDVEDVPAHQVRTIDKTAIAKAIRGGIEVAGARLITSQRLEVK